MALSHADGLAPGVRDRGSGQSNFSVRRSQHWQWVVQLLDDMRLERVAPDLRPGELGSQEVMAAGGLGTVGVLVRLV